LVKSQKLDGLTKSFIVSGLSLFTVILLVYGASVLVPLALAILIWFLINAVAAGFQSTTIFGFQIQRRMALVLALITTLAAMLVVVELVVTNLSVMGTQTIDFESSLNPLIDKIADWTGVTNTDVLNKALDTIGLEKLFGRIVSATASFSSQIGVVLVYVIFLLIEQQFFEAKLRALIKEDKRRDWIRGILEAIARDVQSYMWIMTMLSGLTAALSYGIMKWTGLEHAAFWALLIFFLNFIPTIGSILSTVFPTVFAMIQFQGFSEALTLFVAVGVVQFLIGNFLQPRLAAKTLNMSQFVVILSLFVWGAMWGVVGMFLAVPITVIMLIIFSNFETTKPVAILLSQDGKISNSTTR
jgi:AI-2 transport protein TqsA